MTSARDAGPRDSGGLAHPTYRGLVTQGMCDQLGHMNVQHHTRCFGEAAFALMGLIGLGPEAIAARRIAFVAARMEIDYLAEIHVGAVVSVWSAVADPGARKVLFLHDLVNDSTGAVAARATVVSVCLDMETRRSCAIPDDVRRHLDRLAAATRHRAENRESR